MRRWSTITIIVLLVAAGCGPSGNPREEKARLLQTDRDFSQMSLEKGMAEAFRHYLTEEALKLPARSEPVRGRETIYQRLRPYNEGYQLRWDPQDGAVAQSGELGYTWGYYSMHWRDEEGKEQVSFGKYLNIWEKQAEGEWRVLVDMGNENASPPSPEKEP